MSDIQEKQGVYVVHKYSWTTISWSVLAEFNQSDILVMIVVCARVMGLERIYWRQLID